MTAPGAMRLLFVIKSVALGAGGAERVLADVSSALAARGHEVTVASFDRTGAEPFYSYSGVPIVELGVGDVSSHTTFREAAGRVRKLRRLVKQTRPDAVVGFMHSAYIPAAIALLGTRVPLIASEHISYDHYSARRLERYALRLAPLLSEAMTVQSAAVREGFPDALRRHMQVMPNPVSFRSREEDETVGGRSRRSILAVGRLEEQKDHKTLVEAFARVARQFPDWDLRILGEGRLRPQLEQVVAREKLEKRVSIPGVIRDVGAEYGAADIFVMPSLYESFGIATAEALAAGLPAVGFADCPGTNDLIRNGVNGLLVQGADRVQALADGLARLMADDGLRARLGDAGPDSVERFSLESVTDDWERILERVVRHGR